MAAVIDEFLIAIGFDADTKGIDQADKAMDGLKTRALQLGAALASSMSFNSLVNIANDINQQADKLGKLGTVIGSTARSLDAMSFAYGREGGGLGDLVGDLEKINALRVQLQENPELFGNMAQQRAMLGFDLSGALRGVSAEEGLRNVMREGEGLSGRQLQNFRSVTGFSDAFTRLSQTGTKAFDSYIKRAEELGVITNSMATSAASYNDSLQDAEAAARGLKIIVTEGLTPALVGFNERLVEFFGSDFAKAGAREAAGAASVVIDNAEELATLVGVAVGVASLKKGIPALLGLLGGPVGLGLGAAGAAFLNEKGDQPIGEFLSDFVDRGKASALSGFSQEQAEGSILDEFVPIEGSDVPFTYRAMGFTEEQADAIQRSGQYYDIETLDSFRNRSDLPSRLFPGGLGEPQARNSGGNTINQNINVSIDGAQDPVTIARVVQETINRNAIGAMTDMQSATAV